MQTAAERIRSRNPARRIVVALDVHDPDEALRLADSLRPELCWVKVGLELFAAAGPDAVRRLVSMGLSVFLDLKLHDIPNTVGGAIRALGRLGAELTTVHAGGGACVRAAAEAASELGASTPRGQRLGILAVTVLTSHGEDELRQLYATRLDSSELALRLGRAALAAGADGLVASPLEIAALRERLGPEPLLVIPGIRPAGSALGDQRRVATPQQAIAAGADLLVIGRPITRDAVPRDAFRRVVDEIAGQV
jgi:orotidine-5'-phosphate decarboxylase